MDELGLPIPKPKLVLAKYDTEIEGEKHDSFVLGKIFIGFHSVVLIKCFC
jgi:U4/U6.U5 tri-snRNP-associated protein 1